MPEAQTRPIGPRRTAVSYRETRSWAHPQYRRAASVMITRLFLVIGVFVLGSEATSFTSRSDLKAAVDRCLAFDSTGAQCCGSTYDANCGDPATARCGAAGCIEMPSWDTSSVTDMDQMFYKASAFNADISGWDTSSVTNMGYMFRDASAFNADISGWDTSSVFAMMNMFQGATAFNADISGWDTSYVTDMGYMFYGASAFNAKILGWDTSSVTSMESMFSGATAWLAWFARVDGTSSVDGPPSAWRDTRPSCTSCEAKLHGYGLIVDRIVDGECVVR